MEKRIVDINSINKILHNFYSYKLSIAVPKMFNNHVFLIGRLYEAFEFKCGIDPDEHNSFHFSIMIEGFPLDRFFGVSGYNPPTEKNIVEILEAADRYCRLRLPDKYLEAYEEAFAKK